MNTTGSKSLFETLTFKGVALAILAGALFPHVAKPVENILLDFFPENRVLIVNGISIAGSLLMVTGGATALKGRIDVGDVTTPKYCYGPDASPPEA